ncbi:rRNA maturation RNase YbeY [Marixanthomonas sp. SCSIO 43207]|uniref:rRNA maturation RNase YbeY n=1 Tax=Marixanthomonas sp. SCSIO 43207 TaxID=2779360 RepID=UPI001CA9982B|nr:rRNA maturation RNase YbeY [Marixanthomonas sp. SCSIO 43207]UAB81939.1 rRNA maturation RNase YbeY [Marixanthomonas sp. SCSIO 43207]
MIEFYSENQFKLKEEEEISKWISSVITSEGCIEGEITYIFCDDEYLHKLNLQFLNHDTLTDIISFDNSLGKEIHGEIYISTQRVEENAKEYNVTFDDELHRVIIHGILHYCGYKDKSKADQEIMRTKENDALQMRTFL